MSNTNKPIVSIVALCYNHSLFLKKALDSIYAQDYSNIQLIIIDDDSNDDSVIHIEKWLVDKKLEYDIIFIKHQDNIGLCGSINEGIGLSKGKYFQAFACDDVMLQSKISYQVDVLENSQEELKVIYSDVAVIDHNDKLLSNSLLKQIEFFPQMPTGKIFEKLIEKDFIPAPSVLMKMDVFKEVGLYDTELYYEDWDMFLRIAKKYQFAYLNKTTVRYRKLSTSMFHSTNSRFYESTLSSQMNYFGLSQFIDEILKKRFIEYSLKLYDIDAIKASYWLFRTYIITKNTKVLKYLILSSIGFKVRYRNKLKSLISDD